MAEMTDAAHVRAGERAAILRLAQNVAGKAARAAGYKDAAEVSENFIAMVLNEAFAARDAELRGEATSDTQPPTAVDPSGG